jgi:hypothetical protein
MIVTSVALLDAKRIRREAGHERRPAADGLERLRVDVGAPEYRQSRGQLYHTRVDE